MHELKVASGEMIVHNLGTRPYREVWELQHSLFDQLLNGKLEGRNDGQNHLFLCQHPHVITLGKSGKEDHIQIPEFPGVEYIRIDRGGDITYHGPGQLVIYPILDLEQFGLSLKQYIYLLEQAVIDLLQAHGIASGRIKEYTGVWINPASANPAKIAAIGVKSSRYVTMHGMAFNIRTDLSYFDLIIPCGIPGKAVTSLEKELKTTVDFDEISREFVGRFLELLKVPAANTLWQNDINPEERYSDELKT